MRRDLITNMANGGFTDRDEFLRRICAEIANCERIGVSDEVYVRSRLASVRRDLQYVHGGLLSSDEANRLLQALDDAEHDIFERPKDDGNGGAGYQSSKTFTGRKGRPAYQVSSDMLKTLIASDCTVDDMSSCLGVSTSTVKRRLRSFELPMIQAYAPREDIDEAVKRIATTHRLLGPNSIRERLRMEGLNASREMVRDACRRMDPDGVAMRSVQRHNIMRRAYHVKHPNSLWHLDGNLKLVRWSFYVHGCVDGYSRLITFMRVSTNNRAQTVLDLFKDGEKRCGLPTRLRVDRGVENVDVCRYMNEKRASIVNPVLVGKSCHNQRIERLWVDVWSGLNRTYRDMFLLMEAENTLDITSRRHLWALHFVFLPRLNYDMEAFVFQWNHHKLSTEHHKSPTNLFMTGMLSFARSSSQAVAELFEAPDETEPAPSEEGHLEEVAESDGESQEEMPAPIFGDWDNSCPFSAQELQRIKAYIDPLEQKQDTFHGENIFRRLFEILG